jgi:perosamine synthetase
VKIKLDSSSIKEYHKLIDSIFNGGFLSEGNMLDQFEKGFSDYLGLSCAALNSGGAALLAIYDYCGLNGKDVIIPSNTFWATSVAAKKVGANIIYADCNRNDLCISLNDIKKKVTKNTKAVVVVHIGSHIAFEIKEIAEFCGERDIFLIEDCAQAHGAHFNGHPPGYWGVAGAYSFYSTKTMPLGEGGIVCSQNEELIDWVKRYRNYGKLVKDNEVHYTMNNGFNFRMNEVTAALGIIQLKRLEEILQWKRDLALKYDQIFERRVRFPEGMVSGYYKYIVFDYSLKEQTGKVFNRTDFGSEIESIDVDLPNSFWVAEHHSCLPIWHGWPHADKDPEQLFSLLKN